ncbi:SDR family NAD(P)-dependent oxidoreductase [Streptomyces sp. NPDC059866]|uniref:SDR family NAD(P)-dependent oxidoreductase n=1 Tax=Streptomyces sp. NPDC059866 TaxID=3346978 RepID=UPI00365318DA
MSTPDQKVAVITGASQGIGTGLVDAYRRFGYAVVATSRSITPSQDPNVITVQGDIADTATAERVTSAAIERFGRIDTVQITTSLVDHASSALPSVLASLTKGGLQAATRSLAIEYAGRGTRSNAVALGVIKTPMHPQEYHDTLGAMHPMGRMGEIQDVVDAVLYLEKAPFVTGEILHVDGGQSAGH